MAYAAIQDMVARYGEEELIRLAGDATQDMGSYDVARVGLVLGDVSGEIDSYLRRRYATPITPVPPELTRAACILARHALAQGDGREPTTQMTQARKEVFDWLKALGDGALFLAAPTANAPQVNGYGIDGQMIGFLMGYDNGGSNANSGWQDAGAAAGALPSAASWGENNGGLDTPLVNISF